MAATLELAVTPPRTGERTLLAVENLLGSIAVPEPFALELAGDADGVTLLARCEADQVVRGQIATRYPQARIHEVPADEDPLLLGDGEQAWSITLRSGGPEYVPLRSFRDDDLLDAGADPLMGLLGALADLREGERVVARLLLRSLGPDWAEAHQERPHRKAVQEPYHDVHTSESRRHTNDGVALAILFVAGAAALKGYQWWQAGEGWKAVALGSGIALGLTALGWAWHRFRKSRRRVHDPLLIKEKVSRIAFEGEVQVFAILPQGSKRQRATELLGAVAAAYRDYDHPAGARFRGRQGAARAPAAGADAARRSWPVRQAQRARRARGGEPLASAGARRTRRRSLRARGRRSCCPRRAACAAAPTSATPPRARRARSTSPPDLLRGRHHLYVARTRMGKSTLMQHLVVHKLREKAAGRDGDAIIVVDPHADLVEDLLGHVPESLIGQVRLVDLADGRGAPGINLLDTRVFTDRDRTADSVVRVAKGLWEQWGPRMQSILEQTVKTLHEANAHPDTATDEQHTILDGLPLLTDEGFRAGVLEKVSDPYLLPWWGRDFASWTRQYQADALAPVQTRLSYYASSKRARAILGQPRSTIDLRRTILDGGHPVRLDRAGHGREGRGRARRLLDPQPRRCRHPRAGRAAARAAPRRAGRGRRDAGDAGGSVRIRGTADPMRGNGAVQAVVYAATASSISECQRTRKSRRCSGSATWSPPRRRTRRYCRSSSNAVQNRDADSKLPKPSIG